MYVVVDEAGVFMKDSFQKAITQRNDARATGKCAGPDVMSDVMYNSKALEKGKKFRTRGGLSLEVTCSCKTWPLWR